MAGEGAEVRWGAGPVTISPELVAFVSGVVALVGVVVRSSRQRALADARTVVWLQALDGRLGAIEDALGIVPTPRARSEPSGGAGY